MDLFKICGALIFVDFTRYPLLLNTPISSYTGTQRITNIIHLLIMQVYTYNSTPTNLNEKFTMQEKLLQIYCKWSMCFSHVIF